jgi:hypothetical protein
MKYGFLVLLLVVIVLMRFNISWIMAHPEAFGSPHIAYDPQIGTNRWVDPVADTIINAVCLIGLVLFIYLFSVLKIVKDDGRRRTNLLITIMYVFSLFMVFFPYT